MYEIELLSQLIEGMFVSPALDQRIVDVKIMHVNADYPDALSLDTSPAGIPYKSSDHDIPMLLLQLGDDAPAAPAPAATAATEMPVPASGPDAGTLAAVVGGVVALLLVGVASVVLSRRRRG